jgi:hypothetical protein
MRTRWGVASKDAARGDSTVHFERQQMHMSNELRLSSLFQRYLVWHLVFAVCSGILFEIHLVPSKVENSISSISGFT